MIYHFEAEQTDAGLNFDIQLDQDKKVYCFIGENSVGKTNLLENMAKIFMRSHSIWKKYDDNPSDFDTSILSCNKQLFDTTDLPRNFLINGKEINFAMLLTHSESIPHTNNIFLDHSFTYIGAKERGFTQNIDKNHVKILGDKYDRFVEAFTRSFRYMTGQAVEDTAIADWFNSRLIINPAYISQDKNLISEVITVLELMQELEPSLEGLLVKENGETRINISFSEGKLRFDKTPIDKLSTGFVSIIKIFQEIIAGYGGWGGLHGETDLKNMDGVVFIDEIESHLHPKWQYKFIPLLKKFFPNTTFYIATHSPTIVSTTDEGEAYELIRKGNDVTARKLGNPREWYLVDVFSQGFHVDFDEMEEAESETPSLANMLRNFSEMVKDYTIGKDESLKQKIEDLYQKILPSLPEDDPRRRSLDSLKGLVK